MGNHYNLVLQSAFFHLVNIIPGDEADSYMKDLAKRTYFAKGDEVVARNCAAIDAGATAFKRIEIPAAWLTAVDETSAAENDRPAVVKNIADPINRQKGHHLRKSPYPEQ